MSKCGDHGASGAGLGGRGRACGIRDPRGARDAGGGVQGVGLGCTGLTGGQAPATPSGQRCLRPGHFVLAQSQLPGVWCPAPPSELFLKGDF